MRSRTDSVYTGEFIGNDSFFLSDKLLQSTVAISLYRHQFSSISKFSHSTLLSNTISKWANRRLFLKNIGEIVTLGNVRFFILKWKEKMIF